MGYRKTVRHLTISLKGHPEYGTEEVAPEVVARGKNLDEYLRLMGYVEDESDDRSGVVRQLQEFGASLISWNLEEEDGTPIPCTPQALFAIDNDLALTLATEWVERLGGKTNGPLPHSSPAGEPSPAVSIPMEPLSSPQPHISVPA
ncbi:hypothetical protein [Streptomyces sp. SAS_275]|uniref:hypothetical protein n=1 Tax=Streptomyces sp. SAS_275 TaxID=3412746 RepID=UPI00403CF415